MSKLEQLDKLLVGYGAEPLENKEESQVEHFSSTLTSVKEILEKVPDDGEYEYYSIFPEFAQVAETVAMKAVDTIQSILMKFDPTTTLNLTDNNNLTEDYEFGPIETLLDNIIEKTDKYLDISKGVRTDDKNKEGVLQSTFKPEVQKSTVIKYDDTIPKPQLSFKDPVDNSLTPFVPKITEKPNAMVPLKIEEIHEDTALNPEDYNNSIFNNMIKPTSLYRHPYEYEISNFKFADWMLQEETPIPPKSLEDTPLILVDTYDLLVSMINDCKTQKMIAIDLEHHNLRSYQGFTCLIQLSTLSTDYIIDCIKIREYVYLMNEITTNPSILKVLHGADMDIVWLQKDFGVYIVNMFDSGQASRNMNFPSFSLAYLLKTYCNVQANKEYQLADWRIRPLDENMLHYAREDTHYLLYIYMKLKEQLLSQKDDTYNPLLQVYKASNMLTLQTYEKPHMTDNDLNMLITKKGYNLNVTQKDLFKEIYRWRDQYARDLDESPGFLMSNIAIYKLAVSPPSSIYALKLLLNPLPNLLVNKGNELIQLIKNFQNKSNPEDTNLDFDMSLEDPLITSIVNHDIPNTESDSTQFFNSIINNDYVNLIMKNPQSESTSFSLLSRYPRLPISMLEEEEMKPNENVSEETMNYVTYLRNSIDVKRRSEVETIYKKLNIEQLVKDMTTLGLPPENDTIDFSDPQLLSLSTPTHPIHECKDNKENLLFTTKYPKDVYEIYNSPGKEADKSKKIITILPDKSNGSPEEAGREEEEEEEAPATNVHDQSLELTEKDEEFLKRAGVTVELLRKIEPQAYNSQPKKENAKKDEMEVFTPIQGVDYNANVVKKMMNANMPQMSKSKRVNATTGKSENSSSKNNNVKNKAPYVKKVRGNGNVNKSISYTN